jgi:hypothetical protein
MTRALYRCLLQLHPPAFRRQFAGEMLWIFEEASASEGAAALFADGLVSLARQWLLRSGSWKVIAAVVGALLEVTAGGLGGAMFSRTQFAPVLAATQFAGHWTGTFRSPRMSMPMELALAKNGAAWTGEVHVNPAQVVPAIDIVATWPSLRFRVRTPDAVLLFRGRLTPRSQGSRIQGTFEGSETRGSWELSKQ